MDLSIKHHSDNNTSQTVTHVIKLEEPGYTLQKTNTALLTWFLVFEEFKIIFTSAETSNIA